MLSTNSEFVPERSSCRLSGLHQDNASTCVCCRGLHRTSPPHHISTLRRCGNALRIAVLLLLMSGVLLSSGAGRAEAQSAGSASSQKSAATASSAATPKAPSLVPTRTYTVQPGDSLSSIAERELGHADFAQWILRLNPQVRHADHILAGYPLLLPIPSSADPTQEFDCGDDGTPRPIAAKEESRPVAATHATADATSRKDSSAAKTQKGAAAKRSANPSAKKANTATPAVEAPAGFLVSANIAPNDGSEEETSMLRGVAQQLREIPAELGVVGIGLGLLVTLAVIFDLVVFLLLGGLALWVGASVVRIPEVSFGRAFAINTMGALVSIVVAGVLWGGMLGFAMSDAGEPYMPQEPGQWILWFMVSLVLVTGLQALAYTTVAWRGLGTTFIRAGFACAMTMVVQIGLSAATAILAFV